MGESRKNPFPGRRGVKHLLGAKKMDPPAKPMTPSQQAYHKVGVHHPSLKRDAS